MAGRWLFSLLALLLCSCCFSLCASGHAVAQTLESNRQNYHGPSSGATLVALPVDVSCADSTGTSIKWRFKGGNDWKNCDNPLGYCDYTVDGADQDEEIVVETLDVQENGKSDDDASASICLAAYSLYTSAKCNESCKANHENEVAFTMSFTTDSTSEANKRWTEAKGSSGTPLPAAVASGVCTLTIPSTQPDAVPPAQPPATPAEGKGSQSTEQQTERQGQETNKQPETNGNAQTAEPSEQTQEVAPAGNTPSAATPPKTPSTRASPSVTRPTQTNGKPATETITTPTSTTSSETVTESRSNTEVTNTTSTESSETNTSTTGSNATQNADGSDIVTLWVGAHSLLFLLVLTVFGSTIVCL